MEASVSEIRRHPLRPAGFEEPLFLGARDKKAIAEHLALGSGWLRKAREGVSGTGECRRTGEVCHVLSRPDGSAYLVRAWRGFAGASAGTGCRRRRAGFVPAFAKRRVSRVVERWREVRSWWEPEGGTDRLCFRVLLDGPGEARGAAVELALDRSGSWSFVRVLD